MAGKTEYKNQWQRDHADRINLILPKGKKEIIKAAAEAVGESVNGYIKNAIDQRIEAQNQEESETTGNG